MSDRLEVGLTGGIASGKSTVDGMLERCGARIIDADAVVHRLLQGGTPETRLIAERFGEAILNADGSVNRRWLGELVFAEEAARQDLNAILHPAVRREEEALKAAMDSGGIVVTDAALLVETGRYKAYDRLLVVSCRSDLQMARLLARDRDLTAAGARRRIAAQAPVEDKLALADYVIDTSGSLADTERRTRAVYTLLMEDLACKRQGLPLPARRRGERGDAP